MAERVPEALPWASERGAPTREQVPDPLVLAPAEVARTRGSRKFKKLHLSTRTESFSRVFASPSARTSSMTTSPRTSRGRGLPSRPLGSGGRRRLFRSTRSRPSRGRELAPAVRPPPRRCSVRQPRSRLLQRLRTVPPGHPLIAQGDHEARLRLLHEEGRVWGTAEVELQRIGSFMRVSLPGRSSLW